MVLADVLTRLQALCRVKSQSAVAADLGVSTSHLRDVLFKRRKPGPAIIKGMGLRRVVSYVPIDTGQTVA